MLMTTGPSSGTSVRKYTWSTTVMMVVTKAEFAQS